MQGLLSNTADAGGNDLTRVVIFGSRAVGLMIPRPPGDRAGSTAHVPYSIGNQP